MSSNTVSSLNMTRYLRLVRKFPLVPIENEKQLDRAIQVMNGLVDVRWKRERTAEEDAYLLVLCNLIEKYEDKAYPIEPVSDDAMLEDLLESRGTTQVELAGGAGISRSTISAVLQGKRKFTRAQIGKVAKWFKVSPDVFSAAG